MDVGYYGLHEEECDHADQEGEVVAVNEDMCTARGRPLSEGWWRQSECADCGKRETPRELLGVAQMPWRKTAYIEEEDVAVGGVWFDVGLVEVVTPLGIQKDKMRDTRNPIST